MKKWTLLLAVFVCILTPSVARADDGGFWDMLFHWDTKFVGVTEDFHVLCFDRSWTIVKGCEEFGRKIIPTILHPKTPIRHAFAFQEIKHEFDFRLTYLRSYGERIPDAKLANGDPRTNDLRRVKAWKVVGFYRVHFWHNFDYGIGGGVIPMYGQFVTPGLKRGILTPLSVEYSIPHAEAIVLRFEYSRITGSITGADLGHPGANWGNNGEWNPVGTVGIDLRRIGLRFADKP
jgi:hypothetical protein